MVVVLSTVIREAKGIYDVTRASRSFTSWYYGISGSGICWSWKYFTTAAPATSENAAAGKKIIKLASIKIGSTHNFTTPNGAPAVLFRTKKGVFAYQAICTHQGCTVAYSKSSKHLQCPCHGAEFDPLNSAKPVAGPAQQPLPKVKVSISGAWVIQA